MTCKLISTPSLQDVHNFNDSAACCTIIKVSNNTIYIYLYIYIYIYLFTTTAAYAWRKLTVFKILRLVAEFWTNLRISLVRVRPSHIPQTIRNSPDIYSQLLLPRFCLGSCIVHVRSEIAQIFVFRPSLGPFGLPGPWT